MQLPHPLVLLLGAGATRGGLPTRLPSPPLDADFFDVALQITGRGTRRLARRVATDVFALYNRVSGIGLEEYYRDIETRWELGTFAKSKNKPKDWQRRKEDIAELVRRVLVHTTAELDKGPAEPLTSELHAKLLNVLKDGDTIMTFNYDTLIEESMPDGVSWSPRGGYGVDVSGITHEWAKGWLKRRSLTKVKESGVKLIKLHGSINWTLYKTGKVRLKPRPYVVRARRGSPIVDKAAILPPGWHKRVDKNPYRRLWQLAHLRLEKCAALAVIGYSLPETDLIAKALFLEATRKRAFGGSYLKELHVADINEATKNRLVSLFAPALGSKGRVFRYDSIQHVADAWAGTPSP